MGKGAGTPHFRFHARTDAEAQTNIDRRGEGANTTSPAREGRPREEHDHQAGSKETIVGEKVARNRATSDGRAGGETEQ